MESSPCVFLDRDGVIVENRSDYIRTWDDVQFYPGVLQALQRLSSTKYKIVIVSNQSAVGRGIISLEDALKINDRIVETIKHAGGRVDDSYICPHTPLDDCDCRKPQPGLLHQAARTLAINVPKSVLIGDALSDLQAGKQAGVGEVMLVTTGRGEIQSKLPEAKQIGPFKVFKDLSQAINQIIQG
jgi:D-glycero-D-manno-heptose 1,7-bisphosphate phosphatase